MGGSDALSERLLIEHIFINVLPISLRHNFHRLKLILSNIYCFLLLIYLIIKRCNLFKEP